MPRAKREKSKTNIYHIVCRALNKQVLFEEDRDYLKYLSIVREAKDDFKFSIYAYCIMSNHIHLVIKDNYDNLSKFISIINQRYSMYYNKKNNRVGYVFSGRFYSETIENKEYFLQCIRYIHQNPLKAMICKKVDDYKFSSIHAYKNLRGNYLDLVNIKPVFAKMYKTQFLTYQYELNHDRCLDIIYSKLSDNEVMRMLHKIANVKNNKEFQEMLESKKCYFILELLDYGIPIMQLTRVSGLTYNKIQKLRLGVIGKVENLVYKRD